MHRNRLNVVWLVALIALCGVSWSPNAHADERAKPQAAESAQSTEATSDNPFAETIAYAQQRVVKLYGGGIGREHGYATGLIVSGEGHILVAQGVYIAGTRLQVVMPDGRVYNAEIERRSDPLQAVLLKIDATTPNHFELAKEPVVQKGDWVLSVSNAFKVADRTEPLSVNLGVVSLRTEIDAKKRAQDVDIEGELLLIDAITSNPGAPGGALMTIDNQLAGMIGKIVESKSTNTRLNYALPADRLRAFLDGEEGPAVVTPTPDAKPDLGIRLFALNKRAPAYIDRVVTDSPAHQAGLRSDDLVLAVDGQIIRNVEDCKEAFAKLTVGQEITLVFKRKNDVLSVRLTPAPESE